MSTLMESLHIVEPQDVLSKISRYLVTCRQQSAWTQSDLARRAGVPATTISRLERTGLASTDTLLRILFALDELDGLDAHVSERLRQRLALEEGDGTPRQRVRHESAKS